MEMSRFQPVAAGELPPALQYRLERNMMAGRNRPDAPFGPLARYCMFMSATMLAIAVITVIVSLYAASFWIMHLDEEDTYRTANKDEGEGDSPPDTLLPVYREKVTPEVPVVRLPTSLRKVLNPNDPRYTDPYHKTVCVFHADAVGLTVRSERLGNSVTFRLSYFPFALCRVALFCCPSLAANLEPGPEHPDWLMRSFVVSAQGNPFLSVFMVLGNGSPASEPQFDKLLDDLEAQRLNDIVGSWYEERGYAGMVLRWPETASNATWNRMLKLLAWLQKTLSQSVGLKLGVALRQDAVGPDFTQLASSLGPVSLFLLPPSMPASKYQGRTIRYFSESTLTHLGQLYTNYFAPDGANGTALAQSVCYLLPADAYTFKVTPRPNSPPRPSEPALGPGVEGNVTRVAGRMAYFESCQLGPESRKLRMRYGTVATLLDNWVSYTEPQQLANFLDILHDNASATCMGLWNPQWDDIGELCGTRVYPLARVVFRHYNDTH
ncbi:hypothetical protein MRX96_044561 [Rhipicephalus microplus]